MKILAFAASNSQQSINKQLVTYAASLLPDVEVEVLDLNDYEVPLFSVDRETVNGIPDLAQQFFAKISAVDALLMSYAEHNGSYTAVYKNLYDWLSRIQQKVYQDKAMVLLATSPGPGGAANVLQAAVSSAPHFGGEVKAQLSVPSFFDNFDVENGVLSNSKLQVALQQAVNELRV